MVSTCHVTGVVISPDGDPVPRATVRFQRLPHAVFVEDDKTGIPREVRAEADEEGAIAVDLIPGEYKDIIIARGYNQYPAFNVGVPDQPTAVLADIQDVPPPPSLDDATRAVRDAREARDESREARDEAVVSAQAAEGHATAAKAAAQTATEVAEALPDPEGAASGQLVETDGADGFRLVSPDELRISRALQAVAGTARDLVFFDTFQRAPGPIGISDSGHTWIDHVDALQNGEVAWADAGSNNYRHRSMVVGEFGAAPSGRVGDTTAAMATVESDLIKDSILNLGSGFTLTAHITYPRNGGIVPLYIDNQTAVTMMLYNSSRGLRLSLWDAGSATILLDTGNTGFSRNDAGNTAPTTLSASVLRRHTDRLRINICGYRDEVVVRESVEFVESDNPTLFAKLIDPTGFGIIHGGGDSTGKFFRRVSIERFKV